MTIPIWVASILIGTILGAVSYLVKLILDHDRRIGRLESWRESNPKGK